MYPTLYHALLDLTGLEWCFLRFLNSFGFFVALAFIAAHWTLSLELRRKEAMGLISGTTAKVRVGDKLAPGELVGAAFTGFVVGWKVVPIVFGSCEIAKDAPGFLLSAQGNVWAGLLLATAFAAYRWWQGKRAELPEPKEETVPVHPFQHAGTYTMVAALWGMIGAKLFHWLENPDEFLAFLAHPNGKDFISGLTMYGGLIMAGVMVVRSMRKNGLPTLVGMDAAAPGLMLAYAIGRIGCQVSGDGDWGIVNTTPAPSWMPHWLWSYTYPNNVNNVGHLMMGPCFPDHCHELDAPVFPTPLYETLACGLFFIVLWSVRKRIAVPGVLFCLYLVLNGFERFWIEKIRVNVPFLGKFTQAEVISTLLFFGGIAGWILLQRRAHGRTGPAH